MTGVQTCALPICVGLAQRLWGDRAFLEPTKKLARTAAGRHHPIVVVQDDDDLPALLDEGASAPGFEAKLVEGRVRPRAVLVTS